MVQFSWIEWCGWMQWMDPLEAQNVGLTSEIAWESTDSEDELNVDLIRLNQLRP